MPLPIALWCVAAFLATSVVAIAAAGKPSGHRLVYGVCGIVCLCALAAGGTQLLTAPGGAVSQATLPLGLPWLGAHLRLDALSAFFLIVVNLGGAVASLYGLGYGSHEPSPGRVLPFYPAFLAGMNMVVLADDAYSFLFSWEFMSLSSWALVMAHHHESENRYAGYVYLVMASFGTLALLLAFGVLGGAAGGYGFDSMRAAAHAPMVTALVLALVLLGAGSKAGLVPLHVWLPLAHPAAPSHVSALMSAVMTKVAVYGFIRIVFDLLGDAYWWAAMTVLVLGAASAVLGILQALMQSDIKRLLAYSTVENIGIIFIGLGLALSFQANGMAAAAALAFTAAMLHVFNHSLFKNLLFLGAGAVLTATGQRDMDRMGGLIHRMPWTSALFLVGCVAIAALPPLNGFVSEWLTFQAILQSPALPEWGLKILVPAVGGMLALSAALAGACFVRAYGVTFLGRPRGGEAERAEDVSPTMIAAMAVLALSCIAAGLLPGLLIDALSPVTTQFAGASMPAQTRVQWLSIVPIGESRSSYNGLLVFLFIAASATIAAVAIHRFASHALRRAPAWDCGFPNTSPTTQYTASSFAQPIRRVFGTLVFQARETVDMPSPGEMRAATLQVHMRDIVWDWMFAPIGRAVGAVAWRANGLQYLSIRRYLSLVFYALVMLLLVIAIWQ